MIANNKDVSITGEMTEPGTLAPGEHSVAIDGIELRYHVAGRGPICFVHPGGPGVGWEYMKMPEVEEHLTLVYIEPIGTGSSGRLADPRGYILDRYARYVDGLIEHFRLGKVCLLGHSHGGFVAQRYALQHSERLSGLILYETSPTTTEDFWADVNENLGRFTERHADESWLADVMNALEEEMSVASDEHATDEQLTEIFRRQFPVYFADYSGREREFAPLAARLRLFSGPGRGEEPMPFDMRGELEFIRVPTLIIVGEHDPICSLKWARVLHEGISSSELVVFKRSGHFPHFEEPEAFSKAIRKWFERIPQP